ncbi:hypothetical protein ACI77O_12710 [Pseudomonas tritici]|uniref:hypothetical protein n=1 Tax=Pseudomonas tritici TaxID=2745518 RepID=UPI00387B93E0
MTFFDCLMECAKTPKLVTEFNRLTNRHVGEKLARSPFDALIDKATGYQEVLNEQSDDDLRAFVGFCYECVWARLPQNAGKQTPAFTKDPTVWTPELLAMLGKIPDAVMVELVKALSLNGRTVGTLDPIEQKAFDFFRKFGVKYGVVASTLGGTDDASAVVAVSLMPNNHPINVA